jgi:SAM-dependent methyltransferase
MSPTGNHWEIVYRRNREDEVSWFQCVPQTSLAMIEMLGLEPEARIIDVGGGASRLADGLLNAGYRHITVLDISEQALQQSQARLGERANLVEWIAADVTTFQPDTPWDLWHDRAVFHFLVTEEARAEYRRTLERALRPGGHVIIATFGPGGPETCSGLSVVRYDPEGLAAALGANFRLCHTAIEQHTTPTGRQQEFLYCWLQRKHGGE